MSRQPPSLKDLDRLSELGLVIQLGGEPLQVSALAGHAAKEIRRLGNRLRLVASARTRLRRRIAGGAE